MDLSRPGLEVNILGDHLILVSNQKLNPHVVREMQERQVPFGLWFLRKEETTRFKVGSNCPKDAGLGEQGGRR